MTSPRYFEVFYNADPMVELTESAAKQLGDYVLQDDEQMRRYRRIINDKIDSVIYAGWDDPSEPIADLARLDSRAPAEVHSPVEYLPNGGKRWRTWHITAVGEVVNILEREHDPAGNPVREGLYAPSGELLSYVVFEYADDGLLLEVITHAPDGTVTNRQDA